MQVEVLGFRVAIKPDNVEKEYDLGDGKKLVLVEDEKVKRAATTTGTIVGIGPIAWKAFQPYEGPWAKIGDRVHYAKYSGKFLKNNEGEEDIIILNDEDVLGKVIEGE